jgi:hypothetical protein
LLHCCRNNIILLLQVSPWEIQPDQDDAPHAAETARTAAQEQTGSESTQQQGGGMGGDAADSSAAAQRAARRRASRAIDISSLIGAMDDDDEYNPLADGNSSDSDCGDRRRGRRGRGGAAGGVTWGSERGPKGSKRGRGSDDEDFRVSEGQPPGSKRGGRAGGGSRGGGGGAGSGAQQWGMDQIKQQQGAHLALKQQQMLAAMLAGKMGQAALAQLLNVPPTAPIHDQPLPTPLKPVRSCGVCSSRFAVVFTAKAVTITRAWLGYVHRIYICVVQHASLAALL